MERVNIWVKTMHFPSPLELSKLWITVQAKIT